MKISLKNEQKKPKTKWFKLIVKGFLMNGLNPKVSLFFIAFLPQFISENAFSPTIQSLILGGIFMLITLIVFGGIAVFSGKLSPFFNHPCFWNITKIFKITFFILLALSLFIFEG